MSNGSEAATLGVYCTEMTGANETTSTFSAGSTQRVRLSQWPQTSRTVGKRLPSSKLCNVFPKPRDHRDFALLKARIHFGARLSGCCSSKCGKKGLGLFSLTWKTYMTYHLMCWFYFLNIAYHRNKSWLQFTSRQLCPAQSNISAFQGRSWARPRVSAGKDCAPTWAWTSFLRCLPHLQHKLIILSVFLHELFTWSQPAFGTISC